MVSLPKPLARRPLAARSTHSHRVMCNATGGSDSRVRFQTVREAPPSHMRRQAPENGKLWTNGSLSQGRRPSPQVSAVFRAGLRVVGLGNGDVVLGS